ncbi:DNA helicase RecQ [Methanogenium sp. MK-MG]|uniref:DNA helicase RecQ n=1 Tax=Methanogenium sp. MK-MG TaxID=2599926 RepID=UPI0013ED7432|nr:DNA helicase RecQ [Methanogenium sp. MK-MG]KAF1073701.1 DEAD-box ATP-dependent RNA helicase CshA [Methanogenium sp. MK-MG]
MPLSDATTVLRHYFGYDSLYPYQEEIIQALAEGEDVLGVIATGGGKSLCYQIPALISGGTTVVISPLIALMKDQVDTLRECGVPAACITSLQDYAERRETEAALARGAVRVLYVSPERAVKTEFFSLLKKAHVSLIAVDEAHCISQWGHEFRPEYRELARLIREFPQAPVVALTATATPAVQNDIIAQLHLRRPRRVTGSFYRKNLCYEVRQKKDTKGAILSYIRDHRGQSGIIYCLSRKGVKELADTLRLSGIRALPYHAGLTRQAREEAQEAFVRDRVQVIVATVAFGMGIDKPDVRFVIHHDLPRSPEHYYQETGRAGRDGDPADCILFYSPGDLHRQAFFIRQESSAARQKAEYAKLGEMAAYCEEHRCRQAMILQYFGEEPPAGGCGTCDVCCSPRERFDGTAIARTAITCVQNLEIPCGSSHLIDLLRGANTKKIREMGQRNATGYGTGKAYSKDDWRSFIRELVRLGYLERESGVYPVLTVGEAGRELLAAGDDADAVFLTRTKLPATRQEEPADPLFLKLKALRREIADREEIAPYMIFSDAALRAMIASRPETDAAFLSIKGVGAAKLERFGRSFMAALRPVENVPDGSAAETLRLYRAGCTMTEIAERRSLTPDICGAHIAAAIDNGEPVEIDDLVPPHRQATIREAAAREGTQDLRRLKTILGERFSYTDIRLTCAVDRQHAGR